MWNSKTGALQQTIVSSSLQLGEVSCLAWNRNRQVRWCCDLVLDLPVASLDQFLQTTRKRRSTHQDTPLIGGGVGLKVIVWDIMKDTETLVSV